MSPSSSSSSLRRYLTIIAVFIAGSVLIFAALIIPITNPLSEPRIQAGLVATEDILAPEDLTYPSDLLTEELRQRVVAEVAPMYTPTDTSVARQQLERLRTALTYITSVRADQYASMDQKLADLSALEEITLDPKTALSILDLSDSRWQAVQQEAIIVLEQIMRTTIREDRLEEARKSILAFISLALSEDQANIVDELVSAFMIPNSLYDETLTKAARQQARAAVEPVTRSFVTGETIVQRGKIINDLDIEALSQYSLLDISYRWQDLASVAALSLLTVTFLGIYVFWHRRTSKLVLNLGLIAILFLVFLFAGRLIIPGHTVLPYMFPVAAYGMTVSTLIAVEPAIVTSLPLAILITFGLPYSLELTLFYVLTSLFGIFALGRAQRVTSFLWAAGAITASGMAVILVFRFPNPTTDLVGLVTLAAASLFNGIASSGGALLLQFFLAQILGKTTSLQLMELLRPDNPLLQLLLRNAPGTYQHSLQVANLVEQAAERIGADSLLARVGALYHDIGKITNSAFFIENQLPGNLNPHDDMDPVTSAAVIINHVSSGLELARKYRLPKSIQDFIAEHHGLMITRYQYGKAIEAVEGEKNKVPLDKFRYPGPRPRSRETALLMLADGSEAHVRADRPKDEVELRKIIRSVIDNRISSGALDDTDLTLRDLDAIVDSFTATLRGMYHPRIQYPKYESVTEPLKATDQQTSGRSSTESVTKPATESNLPVKSSNVAQPGDS